MTISLSFLYLPSIFSPLLYPYRIPLSCTLHSSDLEIPTSFLFFFFFSILCYGSHHFSLSPSILPNPTHLLQPNLTQPLLYFLISKLFFYLISPLFSLGGFVTTTSDWPLSILHWLYLSFWHLGYYGSYEITQSKHGMYDFSYKWFFCCHIFWISRYFSICQSR